MREEEGRKGLEEREKVREEMKTETKLDIGQEEEEKETEDRRKIHRKVLFYKRSGSRKSRYRILELYKRI